MMSQAKQHKYPVSFFNSFCVHHLNDVFFLAEDNASSWKCFFFINVTNNIPAITGVQ